MTNQGEGFRYLDDDYWTGRWEGNNYGWHNVNVNPLLAKYISLLDGGKKDLKVFVPMCGKTVDLKWLFELGHRVVGVDCCRFPLDNFFKDHSMEYTVEMKNGIPVYTEKSGRIVLYCCNIFDFHKSGEGSFDAVWDRGGFEIANPAERQRYVDALTSFKKPNTAHLMELFEFDDTFYKEPPFSIPMSKVLEYWGETYDVQLIDSQEAPDIVKIIKVDFKWLKRSLYLMTLK